MGVPLAFKDDLAADALAMKRAEIALVTRVSRRERLGQAERSIGRWQGSLGPGQALVKTVGSFWPYATTVFDYV